jgi:hypothetical protein
MDNEISQQILEELRAMNAMLASRGTGNDPTAQAAQKNAKALGESAAAAEALAEAEEEAAKAANLLKQTMNNLMGTLGTFGRSLTDINGKMSDLGNGFDSLGDAALDLGKNFGPLGIAAGVAAKALTSFATASLKQTEATLEARDSLTKLGGAGIGTGKEILGLAHAAKINAKNLDLLVKPMQSATGSFLGLGATVADGQKSFMRMTAVTEDQRKAFGRLGLSQGDLIQAQADYINLQRMSGVNLRNMGKSMDQIRQASLDYTKNLVELAAISGGDIESAKRAKELANTQMAELIQTRKEQAEIANLRRAGASAEERQRADEIEARQKYRKQLIEEMSGQFGEGTGEAIAQYFATGVVNESVAPLLRQGVDLENQRQKFLAAGNDADKQMQARASLASELKRGEAQTLQNMGSAMQQSDELAKQFGYTRESLQKYGAIAGRDELQARKDATKAVTDQMKTGADPMADTRENLRETQRTLAVGLDQLLLAVNPLTKSFGLGALAFGGLTIALGVAAKALTSFSMAAGGKGAAGAIGGVADAVGGGGGAAGKAGKLGKLLSIGAKGAGIAAVGTVAGGALEAAGQNIGGTTGKVVSGAGTVAQYASMGAILGPMGALAGGVIGLAKAVYDNNRDTKSNTEATFETSSVSEEIARQTQEAQNRVQEQNKKLADLLGQNNAVISQFSGRMESMTQIEFEKLVKTLEETGQINKEQVEALRQQRSDTQKQAATVTQQQQQTNADKLRFRDLSEVDPSKDFTMADRESLNEKKAELEILQQDLFKSKTFEERKAIEDLMAQIREEKKALEEKEEYELEYREAERERIKAEREKQALVARRVEAANRARAELARRKAEEVPATPAVATTTARPVATGGAGQGQSATTARPAATGGGGGGVATTTARPAATGGGGGGVARPPAQAAESAGSGGGGGVLTGLFSLFDKKKEDVAVEGPTDDIEGKVGGAGSGTDPLDIAKSVDATKAGSSAAHGPRKTTEGLIVHHTGGRGLQTAIDTLKSRGLGYHYLIDRDGTVVNYVNDSQKAWHAGKTDKKPDIGNRNSVGMALVAKDDKDLTKEQMMSAFALGQQLMGKYGISAVYGHGETSSHKNSQEGVTIANALRSGKIQADAGGVVSGPDSGFPATLHGKEMIVPLQGDSLLEKLGKMSADQLKQEMSTGSDKMQSTIQSMLEMNQRTSQEWISKLDTMINVLENSRSTQEKTLRAVRT